VATRRAGSVATISRARHPPAGSPPPGAEQLDPALAQLGPGTRPRVQGPDEPGDRDRARAPGNARRLDRQLRGVGRVLGVLRPRDEDAGLEQRQRLDQGEGAGLRQAALQLAARLVRGHRGRDLMQDGPVSMPAAICMIVTPVSSSPRMIACWMGAAPRSAGRREAWTLIIPRAGSSRRDGLRMWPYATTIPTSGSYGRSASRNAGSFGCSGWSTGMPSARAASFTGGGTSVERDRPCGRSGWVTTARCRSLLRRGRGAPERRTRGCRRRRGACQPGSAAGTSVLMKPLSPLRCLSHFLRSMRRLSGLR